MKTITVSRTSTELLDLLKAARKESITLRDPDDGTEFILAELDDFDKEVELTRNNEELMAYLETRAKQAGRTSHADVKKLVELK